MNMQLLFKATSCDTSMEYIIRFLCNVYFRLLPDIVIIFHPMIPTLIVLSFKWSISIRC